MSLRAVCAEQPARAAPQELEPAKSSWKAVTEPVMALDHARQEGSATVENTRGVDIQALTPGCWIHLPKQGRRPTDSCIVNQDIDPAKMLHSFTRAGLYTFPVRDINF